MYAVMLQQSTSANHVPRLKISNLTGLWVPTKCFCRKSSKSREEAYATLRNTEQATTQNKQQPTGSDVIQWESGFIKQYLYAN